ncbi:pentatricopeptide repeat-containing protein At5g65570 [Diospyros lotus]|uniref:pentatricopeptide repeat-containing protein At5g65570 n=1 Tax=Diospyros lotus TaxID=55363 RepID=UPI002250D69E|nr:pentatricopeptide repeat-containing protein At5g65570 [Diospyros lotus]
MQAIPCNSNRNTVGFAKFLNFARAFETLSPPTLSDGHPSYASLIQRCRETKSITELAIIQTHMLKRGLSHLGLGSKLVDGFLKCGRMNCARKLFDEMPHRHVVTWNSLIAAYVKHRLSEEGVRLYDRMILEGVMPDDFTFSSVFKAFADLGLLVEGRRAHGLSVVLGFEVSSVFVGSALVDMYAKFGTMQEARLVADRVLEKDVVLFTALIVGYSQCGENGEAMVVFREMISKGIKPNEYTFASILISCGNLEDSLTGKFIHCVTIKSGFESAVASQTSLLTMYSKCGLVDDSLKVFKHFVNPNQVTWTSLVVGLVQNGREEIALSKFRGMIRSSVIPNSFTFSSVLCACSSLAMLEQGKQIHAMVLKFGLGTDKYTGTALIDLYGKCGVVDMARSVFDGLLELDLAPVNTMIYSFAQNGFGHEALALYERMKELGLAQNDQTLLSVLLACRNAGLVDEGLVIFASASSNPSINLTNEHYACMVDLLGRAGRLREAEMLVTRVENPDVVLWRTLLSACRIHWEVDMAKRVTNMVLELAPRDDGAHVLLSNLFASTGDWNRVIEMKSLMREMRLRKNPAMSWVDIDREVHTFMAGDRSHPNSNEIYGMLEELIEKIKGLGYVPDTRFVLQDLGDKEKERSLYCHSEKLAVAFALWKSSNRATTIRILKNLRVCGDCHNWMKLVSRAVGREIIARDAKRFHHFRDGMCSCGDYW